MCSATFCKKGVESEKMFRPSHTIITMGVLNGCTVQARPMRQSAPPNGPERTGTILSILRHGPRETPRLIASRRCQSLRRSSRVIENPTTTKFHGTRQSRHRKRKARHKINRKTT